MWGGGCLVSETRMQLVEPIVQGLIEAVREGDKVWVRQVIRSVEAGVVDLPALLVSLAGAASDE